MDLCVYLCFLSLVEPLLPLQPRFGNHGLLTLVSSPEDLLRLATPASHLHIHQLLVAAGSGDFVGLWARLQVCDLCKQARLLGHDPNEGVLYNFHSFLYWPQHSTTGGSHLKGCDPGCPVQTPFQASMAEMGKMAEKFWPHREKGGKMAEKQENGVCTGQPGLQLKGAKSTKI